MVGAILVLIRVEGMVHAMRGLDCSVVFLRMRSRTVAMRIAKGGGYKC